MSLLTLDQFNASLLNKKSLSFFIYFYLTDPKTLGFCKCMQILSTYLCVSACVSAEEMED